jgi:predicted ester cyclase
MFQLQNYLMAAILLWPAVSHSQHPITHKNLENSTNAAMTNTILSNKEVVRTIYEEALNKRNLRLLQELISPEYTGIRGTKGAAAFEEPVAQLIKSFPDIQWHIQELIEEKNKVVVKWKLQGTHEAPFNTYAATHKKISNEGVGIFDLQDGKIVASQVQTDRLAFLQDLEVLPLDLSPLPRKKDHPDQVQFIDRFFVPAAAKEAFLERMKINRDFIKTLPGFIQDEAYVSADAEGNLICITVALWSNIESVKKAKELVQEEYKKQGFDLPGFLSRLKITMERAMYKRV